ncbi:methylated-DNA--[protein]-cysteine S-methyltransferase [Dehalogenimonas etheniformans]|uniref:Methylated-DNA--protein-cysteine methyltransferase n=2 Tax=Dehalogenimonas etheniformans TaxID=1536648 RepID=A0A2P5P725_9CHLR|nr:methylated-DNA--[protein]-cysteine S-methyltransferase [Dehalogenimonas etheniformans]QNT77068.1 methylated-DNA--[protein]-cysteine S-methyltransferase [Dehalogenimonas etheniformans]
MVETAQGWVGIEASENGVRRLTLPARNRKSVLTDLGIEEQDLSPGSGLGDRLRHYFVGQPVVFNDGIDLTGTTEFQKQVYEAACRIPYGETKSYGQLAEEIGKPGAARAVGQALGANPVPILIPCHRVVAADGGLGGFSGGIKTKQKLLAMEKKGKT